MKVGIIGATGKAGKLIAKEAYDRGHEITAIVIDPENVDNKDYKVLNKNIFDLTVEDLKDFDTVINCFGVFDPAKLIQHQTSMMTLINIFEQLPDVRLMMVGGAASLYTDETKTQLVLDTIPEAWAGVPKNMKAAFENLKASDVKNWTYFSPAGTFDPKGGRTGSYVLGDNDVAVKNSAGESYISYADFAIAMVDEMENKKYIGKRITAAAEKIEVAEAAPAPAAAPAAANEPKVGLFRDVEFEGNSMYRGALCYELAGQTFHLVMDDGHEYMVTFTSGETLMWSRDNEDLRWETYECMKSDEETYFVNLELANMPHRYSIALILDMEQSLVTITVAHQGQNPRWPEMIKVDFIFGAIKIDGQPLPRKRHGFTTDLVGKRIQWRYTPKFAITHVYYSPFYLRGAGVRDPNTPPPPPPPPEVMKAMMENPYDEVCAHVKIKDNIYLVSFIEENSVKRGNHGFNLQCLIDIDRLHDVGKSYGINPKAPENYLFAAVGKWEESDGTVENQESKYRV